MCCVTVMYISLSTLHLPHNLSHYFHRRSQVCMLPATISITRYKTVIGANIRVHSHFVISSRSCFIFDKVSDISIISRVLCTYVGLNRK